MGSRKIDISREEYEAMGIKWTDTPEYNRQKARECYARKKERLAAMAPYLEAVRQKKESMGFSPATQNNPTIQALPLEDAIQLHPVYAPDGKPWGCPQPDWDVAEYEATPEEDRDRVHGTAKRWEYLAYKSERDHWAAGTHRRQNGLE